MTSHSDGLNRRLSSQAGVMLIEALVAIVVFSVGVLALIALQAVAMREVATSKMRSDAGYVADRIIGDLSSISLSSGTLQARLAVFAGNYTATGAPAFAGSPELPADIARAASWQSTIARHLPNGRVTIGVTAANPPTVTLNVSWESVSGSVTGAGPSPCWIAGDAGPRACFTQAAVVVD